MDVALGIPVISDIDVSSPSIIGLPSTLTLQTAGSGFAPAPGNITNKATTGGSGSGLTLNLVVDSSGATTSATVNKTGEGYKVGDVIQVPIQAGGTAAEYVIYYSNSFDLELRLQSEDRAHRISQTKNVTYIDIECQKSIDSKIIKALRDKKNIADIITNDPISIFLEEQDNE